VTKLTLISPLLAAGCALAREPSQQTVMICAAMDRNSPGELQLVVERAKIVADQILSTAGVRINWRGHLAPCLGESVKAIQADLSWNTPPNLLPGALGYATPFGDAYVRVFCDRIHQNIATEREPYLLGHVLAHEVTHVLQGTNFHSASGVMKAVWDFHECRRMALHPLTFTGADIQLIRQGLENRSEFRPARRHAPVVEIVAIQ